jgi:hypothetical protein
VRREAYLSLRQRYEPNAITLAIVAESPPASGKYFYDPDGAITEPLFAALMKSLGLSPRTKASGLSVFQQRGWILVDATYEPVNDLNNIERDAILIRNYPLLRDDLTRLTPDRSAPIILIKTNVCAILEQRLMAEGFNVFNRGRRLPFPSHGWQKRFEREFGAIYEAVGTAGR